MARPAEALPNPYRPSLLRIAGMRDETPDVRTLSLGFVDPAEAERFPGWEPGQFAEFTVFGAGECVFAISSTTRPMRAGETDGVEYRFVTRERFEKQVAEGYFLEWAHVHLDLYGTPLHEVETAEQTLTARIDAPGATPSAPAMMSATWVPCPSKSIGSASGASGAFGHASPTKS
mgnify:CR=1 FL=1